MEETMTIDPNKNIESPSRRTDSWAFIGYEKDGSSHPIGVFASFIAGTEVADAWMKSDPKAARWEGHILHETLLGGEENR
jgi:hypothetical protein